MNRKYSIIFYDNILWQEHSEWVKEQIDPFDFEITFNHITNNMGKSYIERMIIFKNERDFNWYKIMFPVEDTTIRAWRRTFSQ